MSAHVTHPTPYPDVNAVLHVLLSGVQTVLGNHFIGMYPSGSLASGDFAPQRSDIDFVVVTADELPYRERLGYSTPYHSRTDRRLEAGRSTVGAAGTWRALGSVNRTSLSVVTQYAIGRFERNAGLYPVHA